MKFKPLKTSKLFYKKWPYKIECIQRGAGRMYRAPDEDISSWTRNEFRWGKVPAWSDEERNKLALFHSKVKPFYEKDLQIRVEGGHFNIFCKDKNLLDEITKELDSWIVAIHGPASDEELEFMMSNGHKKRVCNAFPKEKYRYRIYIKENLPVNVRGSFYTWLEKYGDQIDMPPSTKIWLSGNKQWIQNPYIYVEDGPIMTMVSLFLGNNARIIEEFILRSSINTSS